METSFEFRIEVLSVGGPLLVLVGYWRVPFDERASLDDFFFCLRDYVWWWTNCLFDIAKSKFLSKKKKKCKGERRGEDEVFFWGGDLMRKDRKEQGESSKASSKGVEEERREDEHVT